MVCQLLATSEAKAAVSRRNERKPVFDSAGQSIEQLKQTRETPTSCCSCSNQAKATNSLLQIAERSQDRVIEAEKTARRWIGPDPKIEFMMTADEVHLAYGRAMYEVQRFEWATLIGVGLVKVADGLRSKDPAQKLVPIITYVEEAIKKLDPHEKTLGSMFKRLYENGRKENSAFDSILKRANDDRNNMAHYFLLTVDFKSPEGCSRAMADLHSIEERFRKLFEDTKKVIGESLRHVGIAQSDADRIYYLIDRLYLEPRT